MSTVQKLTKRQKKSLAFRERKTDKRPHRKDKHDNELDSMERATNLTMEDQDILDVDSGEAEIQGSGCEADGAALGDKEGIEVQRKKSKVWSTGKGEAEKRDVQVSFAVLKGKKRKRESEGGESEGEEAAIRSKKAKRKDSAAEEDVDGVEKKEKSKQRFILFVGNLKYTTTKEDITKHFSLCDPLPTIRLLTSKAKPGSTQQKLKSKGCAFLEFTHRNALQQALKLHQSNLEGRLINVELTAGGGGKSESRLTKVRERNKALLGQREKRDGKKVGDGISLHNQPQRFSMTSGLEQKSTSAKTWSVGDIDDGQTHRGGKRHRKKSKSKPKTWGTGVNAIPVG